MVHLEKLCRVQIVGTNTGHYRNPGHPQPLLCHRPMHTRLPLAVSSSGAWDLQGGVTGGRSTHTPIYPPSPGGSTRTFSGNADSFSHLATLLDSKGPNCVRLTSWVTANTPSAPSSRRRISRLDGREDLGPSTGLERPRRAPAPGTELLESSPGRRITQDCGQGMVICIKASVPPNFPDQMRRFRARARAVTC